MRNIPKINGRRGVFQLLFSVVYLVIGASFFLLPSAPSRDAALSWITQLHLPTQALACLWIAAALIGLVSAFLPRPDDWRGFAALTLASAVWGFLYLIGAVFFGAPALGIVSTFVYWLLASIVIVVSNMQGPKDRDNRPVVT